MRLRALNSDDKSNSPRNRFHSSAGDNSNRLPSAPLQVDEPILLIITLIFSRSHTEALLRARRVVAPLAEAHNQLWMSALRFRLVLVLFKFLQHLSAVTEFKIFTGQCISENWRLQARMHTNKSHLPCEMVHAYDSPYLPHTNCLQVLVENSTMYRRRTLDVIVHNSRPTLLYLHPFALRRRKIRKFAPAHGCKDGWRRSHLCDQEPHALTCNSNSLINCV